MKTAVLTNVYNESFFLPLWLSHYSKATDKIYIIDSGTTDGSIEKASGEFSFEIMPATSFIGGYSHIYDTLRTTREEVQGIIKRLLKDYDWVIYSHVDEFIFPDPLKYTSLKDYISKLDKDYVYCNGYDVVHDDSEPPLDPLKPILLQRKYWISTNSYSKPLLTRVPLEYEDGFHYLLGDPEFMQKREMDLYLAHMAKAEKSLIPTRNPYRVYGKTVEDFIKSENWGAREEIPEYLKNIL